MEVVLGVTGSIAAYKAAELLRLMVKHGWNVRVVMTPAATEFVTPLTFQTLSRAPVAIEEFEPVKTWNPKHIALSECDLFVVAPATANTLAKIAYGLADNLLTSSLLATRAQIVVVPAMNDGMWDAVATQKNISILKERSIHVIDPDSGELACGSSGKGRLPNPGNIMNQLEIYERK